MRHNVFGCSEILSIFLVCAWRFRFRSMFPGIFFLLMRSEATTTIHTSVNSMDNGIIWGGLLYTHDTCTYELRRQRMGVFLCPTKGNLIGSVLVCRDGFLVFAGISSCAPILQTSFVQRAHGGTISLLVSTDGSARSASSCATKQSAIFSQSRRTHHFLPPVSQSENYANQTTALTSYSASRDLLCQIFVVENGGTSSFWSSLISWEYCCYCEHLICFVSLSERQKETKGR